MATTQDNAQTGTPAQSDALNYGTQTLSKLSEADGDELVKLARMREQRQNAETLFKSAADARKRYDWEWLTRDLFRRGYHFSRYNPNNRTVVIKTRSAVQIPINVTHAQMRTIKNQVTSIRPKWEVLPRGLSEDAATNARYSQELLDYYYDHFNLRRLLKETVIQGLMYSVGGPWQIGYNPYGGDEGAGEIFIWLLDPFDFYIDPAATDMEDAQYCIKAVRTSLNSIRANPAYKFYDDPFQIRGEARLAASEYKQFLLQALKYYQPRSNIEEDEGVILKEAWIKVHVNERNMEELTEELKQNDQDNKNLRMGEVLMRVVTYIDAVEIPLQYKLLRRDDFPYSLFSADVNPMEVYGESWIKHVIPMNRVLNSLESSIFRYNYKYAIGRIVVDKNSGVRIVTNEHGDIIEKNAGAEVSSLPLQPLPQSYGMQIQNMRMYLEDVGGAHEVSMGRIPTGVKSGVGIAELKAADAVNQQDLVDGLEEFLTDVAHKMLREIAENYDVPHIIKALGKSGEPKHFTVIGEDAAKTRKNTKKVKIGTDVFDLTVIGADNEVRVTVGTWLAHTKTARLEQLKEYYQAGLIDQKTFLENAEFADIKNIIDRTRMEDILGKFRGEPAAGAASGVSDEEIAEQENFMMKVEGLTDVEPMPEDNHTIHIAIHHEAMGAEPQPLIEEHIAKHEALMAAQATMQPPRGEGGMPEQVQAPISQPIPALEGVMPPMPGGGAVAGGTPMMGGAPVSPEEAALQQSLLEFTGGQ
jgi:hypothetical protein